VTPVPAAIERVIAAMAALVTLGETIEEEWTYVHDLELVWVARLRAVAAERSAGEAAAATPGLEAAIERLCAETGRITDPHRAIDWLSTLPQATLVAIGEAAW
jgi:hypothetical protein